jgi:uncharacterized protein (DUF58 family)
MPGTGGVIDPLLLAKLSRLSLLARTVVEGIIAGLHKSPYRGLAMEFTAHRPYTPGDEIRRIDWKAYGRLDRFFIKEYEEETNLRAYLMVDASASMGYGRQVSKLRYASLLACSVAYLLLRQRDSMGLVTYRDQLKKIIPPRNAFNHLELMAAELEGLEPKDGTDTPRAIETLASGLKRRSLIVIISDLLDDPDRFSLSLKQLRHQRNDVIVFQVLDPDELELPFDRQTLFLDSESDLRVATNPSEIRREYRKILGEYVERIRSFCHANAVDHQLFNTAEPLDRALVRYLSRREKRG